MHETLHTGMLHQPVRGKTFICSITYKNDTTLTSKVSISILFESLPYIFSLALCTFTE
jgi:hypothetical protein